MQDAPPSAQPAANQDTPMDEDVEAGDGEAEEEEEEEIEPQRVKIVRSKPAFAFHMARLTNTRVQLPGSTDSAASFEFIDEGHTLGNALRYIIMKK